MANEITKSVRLQVNNPAGPGVDSALGRGAARVFSQIGTDGATWTQTALAASDSPIAIPTALGVPRDLTIENLDANNYIEVSYGTGGGFSGGRATFVQPKDIVVIQPISATLYVKAHSADCKIQCAAEAA